MQEDNVLLELHALRKQRALERFLQSDRDLISATDAAALLAAEVTGGPTGELAFVSAQAGLARLRQRAPYLFRSARQDRGIGLEGVTPAPLKTDEQLARELFGKLSNAG